MFSTQSKDFFSDVVANDAVEHSVLTQESEQMLLRHIREHVISDEEYNGYSAISQSDMNLYDRSPQAYLIRKTSAHIEEETVKSYLTKGTRLHLIVENPKIFHERHVAIPDTLTAPSSAQQKAFAEEVSNDIDIVEAYQNNYKTEKLKPETIATKAKELYETLRPFIEFYAANKGKEFVTVSEWASLETMSSAVMQHPHVVQQNYWKPASDTLNFNELALRFPMNIPPFEFFSEDRPFKMEGKGRIDHLRLKLVQLENNKLVLQIRLVDLKTTSTIDDFMTSLNEYNYDRQAFWYWLGVQTLFEPIAEENGWMLDVCYDIVAVSSQSSISDCRVFRISPGSETFRNGSRKAVQTMSNILLHDKGGYLWTLPIDHQKVKDQWFKEI